MSLQVQYIDGTKIESAANKYSFVWRGSVEKYDARLREKTDAVLREIEQVVEAEDSDHRGVFISRRAYKGVYAARWYDQTGA